MQRYDSERARSQAVVDVRRKTEGVWVLLSVFLEGADFGCLELPLGCEGKVQALGSPIREDEKRKNRP